MMTISPYILVIAVSWLVAQGAKYVILAFKSRSMAHFRQLYLSGNMPSAHSATIVAVATLIGAREGFDSAIFGLALTMSGIVMYDAIMVRRSVGEQGLAIQELIKLAKNGVLLPRAAKGHTPMEVLVGAILGVIIGYVVFIATK
jgi:acid phosphatase family membrane protein YuiD